MRYNMSIVLQGINNIPNIYFGLAQIFLEPRTWHGDSQLRVVQFHQSSSKNHQDFKVRITKSPSFFGLNHHHHNLSKSPNHHKIYTPFTISPTDFGLNHQSPNTPWSPPRDMDYLAKVKLFPACIRLSYMKHS